MTGARRRGNTTASLKKRGERVLEFISGLFCADFRSEEPSIRPRSKRTVIDCTTRTTRLSFSDRRAGSSEAFPGGIARLVTNSHG